MKHFLYISPGPFTATDTLVWQELRREVAKNGLSDELLIVIPRESRTSAHDLSRLFDVLMEVVGLDGYRMMGDRDALTEQLHFDGQLRMGRMIVRDDGVVQVYPRLWSDRNKDFRSDMDNLDEDATFAGMKTFRLTGRQMADLGIYEDEGGPEPEPASELGEPRTAWTQLLEDDGL